MAVPPAASHLPGVAAERKKIGVAATISVIIPCLEEATILQSRLVVLQHLRAAGHELILVDGGSSDGSAELANPLVDRVLRSAPGRASQMNAGASEAKGDVLWFLHLDSELPPRAADAVLSAAMDGPGWGRFDIRLSGCGPLLRLVERMMNLRSCLTGIATGDQGIFVRRDLFESVGGYPEIPLMEDIELSARLRSTARPFCLSERMVTSSRRWERDGILRTILTMWFLRTAYWFGADPDWLARIYYPANE
jgi:rSAM/selenodomain-associated transferase 2